MCADEGFVVAGRSLVSVAVHLHRPVCVPWGGFCFQTSADQYGCHWNQRGCPVVNQSGFLSVRREFPKTLS